MQGPRAPWWVFGVAVCVFGYLLLNVYAEIFGPEPVGTDLRFREGRAVVVWVAPGLPGARAGIEAGDVIIEAGGLSQRTLLDWRAALENVEVARAFTIEVA